MFKTSSPSRVESLVICDSSRVRVESNSSHSGISTAICMYVYVCIFHLSITTIFSDDAPSGGDTNAIVSSVRLLVNRTQVFKKVALWYFAEIFGSTA